MMRTSGRCELCLLNDLSQDNLGLTLRPFLEQLNENTKPSRSHTLLEPLYQHLCAPTLQLISTAGASAARPSLPHYLIDCTRTPPFCTCRDHCRRGGQRGAFSVTLLTFTSLFFPVWTHFRSITTDQTHASTSKHGFCRCIGGIVRGNEREIRSYRICRPVAWMGRRMRSWELCGHS